MIKLIKNEKNLRSKDIWKWTIQKNTMRQQWIVQSESGRIFTGFCIEGASGVMNLCAERVAALNMYMNTGETIIKRLIAFRKEPPKVSGGMPCGACREFLMQLAYENRNMEILTDYESRKIVLLKDIVPNWWGDKRYKN